MAEYRLTDFLPTTKKEMELRGWDEVDIILFINWKDRGNDNLGMTSRAFQGTPFN